MGDNVKSEKTIRDYLLRRVTDELALESIEELLFTDEEFCSQVALVEDELINDFVLEHLSAKDRNSFRATIANNPDRRFKLELTRALREKALVHKVERSSKIKPSFYASFVAFFHQPRVAGAFVIILFAVLFLAFFYFRRSNTDELAELRAIYEKGRPTESRISEFGYAPLAQLRGEPEPAEQKRLRRIEINLIEATEKNPSAESHHSLGVFNLTQRKYADAIKEFESALKFESRNAKIHNDLGAAHFELSKSGTSDKRYEELAQGLEEFTRATELDGNLLEALFNKSLAMQTMGMRRESKDSWLLYLQKDSTSQWADEARKNVARIESEQVLFKSEEEVLSDFLAAYNANDYARAERIHNETKGELKSSTIPFQLSKQFLLAKKAGNSSEAQKNLDALVFIGRYEQDQHSEFFFLN